MIFDKHSLKPLKKSDEAMVLIGGRRIAQGTVESMISLFHQEAARTSAKVEMKVKQKNGIYKTKFKHIRPTTP